MLRFAFIVVAAMFVTPAAGTEAGWALLREGGHVVLLRHAITPGSGDLASFNVDDCSTQRNLSESGRDQADRLGVLLSVRAARTEKVLSSRYCRCLETAQYAFDDLKPEIFEALDPLSIVLDEARKQEAAIVERVKSFSGSGNLVMITHKENIEALTGGVQHCLRNGG